MRKMKVTMISQVFVLIVTLQVTFARGKLKVSVTKGDVNLAGIFNLHFNDAQKPLQCGDIDPQFGVMIAEAMYFAVDKINADPSFLNGVKLGLRVYDTCGSATNLRSVLINAVGYNVQGIIGPQYSDDAMMTSMVMSIFGKAVISYSATSAALEDRGKYGNFYRTVSSDDRQVQVMVDLAQYFNWTYVGILNSEGSYGERMAFMFQERALRLGICSPKIFTVPRSNPFQALMFYIQQMLEDKKIKVVYLFLSDIDVQMLLEIASKSFPAASQLTFIAGDSWGSRISMTRGKEKASYGSITVQPYSPEVAEFQEYFLGLKASFNQRNLWFKEFWEKTFNCSFRNDTNPPPKKCSGTETLRKGNALPLVTPIKPVINAVYAFAYVFRKILKVRCISKNISGIDCVRKYGYLTKIKSYSDIYRGLKAVKFREPYGNRTLQFNEHGSMNEDYDIFNFQNTTSGFNRFVKVGYWKGRDINYSHFGVSSYWLSSLETRGDLHLNNEKIAWKASNYSVPVSVCSFPCHYQETYDYQDEEKCCWRCKQCKANDIIRNNSCVTCPLAFVPDVPLTYCIALPVHHVSLKSTKAAVILTISSIGLLFTLFVVVVFIKNFNMRTVRASGRELCLHILAGIAIVYTSPILFLMKPTDIVCGAQRFVAGIGFSICYASLFLKTNRIYRIFTSAQTTVTRPSMVSPKSQVLMALSLSAVQLLLGIVWVKGEPPAIVTSYPRHRQYIVQYCELNMYTLALNLSYSSVLMIISTWFAFKTRHFPKNYNEAKYIGFTMYSSCFALGVLIPVFFFIENDERTAKIYLMCTVCEIISTINVVGLFGPKVKIILLPAKAPGIDPNITSTDVESLKSGLKFVSLPRIDNRKSVIITREKVMLPRCNEELKG